MFVFRPELVDIFTTSSRCPIRAGEAEQPLEIYRIERHVFKTSTFPFVSRVAFRAICNLNAVRVGSDGYDGDSGFDQSTSSSGGAPSGDNSDDTAENGGGAAGAMDAPHGGRTIDLTAESIGGNMSDSGRSFEF